MNLDHRILKCVPCLGNILQLTFQDDVSGIVDLGPLIAMGGVFAPLQDPAEFARVEIQRKGRSLDWPCGVDLCADALWMQVQGMDIRVA